MTGSEAAVREPRLPARARFQISTRLSATVRVALVSDTHGFVDPHVIGHADECDVVVHVGDIGGQQVLKALRSRRGVVFAVRGNNDAPGKWPVGERRILDRLPWEIEVSLPGGTLVAVHGDQVNPASTRHDRLRRRYASARMVVYGHTHRMVCDRDTLPWVVNPGAAGRVRTFGGPSCAILEVSERCWRVRLVRFGASHE
jgi:putative phosphoesterase